MKEQGSCEGRETISMSIATARLLPRRPSSEDIPTLSTLWLDERVQQYLGGVLTQAAAEEKVIRLLNVWAERGLGLWVVSEQCSGVVIGLCGLSPLEDELDLSYKLTPGAWGKGYATEAATASLDDGFHRLPIESIVAMTQCAHKGSQRVLEKLGMRRERTLYAWGAEQYFYRLSRWEWLNQRSSLAAREC